MPRNRTYILMLLLATAGACAWANGSNTITTQSIQQAIQCLRDGLPGQAQQIAINVTQTRSPLAARAWLIVAASRQQQGQYAEAQQAYREFLASCDSGTLREYAVREISNCQQASQKASPMAAPSDKLTDDLRTQLAAVEQEVQVESSDHFVVRSRNAKLSRLIAGEAEVVLTRVCKLIMGGQDYPNTVEIFVWKDHDDYLAHAQDAPEWSGGSFSLSSKDGTIGRRIDLTQLDDQGKLNLVMLDRILPHEMSHLVTREFFGDSPCPLFLNEGLAMISESRMENGRILLAAAVLAGDKGIALEDLLLRNRQDPGDVSVFYAESYTLISYLHSNLNPAQFKEMLQSVKAGCSLSDALHRVLCMPAKEDFMAGLSVAWQKDTVEQAQYLRSLASELSLLTH